MNNRRVVWYYVGGCDVLREERKIEIDDIENKEEKGTREYVRFEVPTAVTMKNGVF
jgi:hypothetical protein